MSKLQKYKCVGCNYETTKAEVASIRCPRCNYKGLTPIPEQTFEGLVADTMTCHVKDCGFYNEKTGEHGSEE